MSVFQQWLDGEQQYEAGQLLYEQHGRNHVLKRTLSHGPSAYNRSALREELSKLAKAGVKCPENVVIIATQVGKSALAATPKVLIALDNTAESDTSASSQLLAGLDKQWKPLYKEASHLQSQLRHAKDKQERCTWAHRILDLMDQVQALWDAGAHVRAHGALPPVVAVVPPPALDLSDPAAVLKHRNNLRSQISKQKRNAERTAEVAAWKDEVKQLDKVLKTLELSK